jgi:hypothetical protein
MNLVFRYIEAANEVMIFNRSQDRQSIFGIYLLPGESATFSSGAAHTMKGMMRNDWMEIIPIRMKR